MVIVESSVLSGIIIFLAIVLGGNLLIYILKYINVKSGKKLRWATGYDGANIIALNKTVNPNSLIKFGSYFYANSVELIDERILEKFYISYGVNLSDYTFISAIWDKNMLMKDQMTGLYITKEIIFSGNIQILTKNITGIQSEFSSISVTTVNETINLFGSPSEGLIPVIKRDINKAII